MRTTNNYPEQNVRHIDCFESRIQGNVFVLNNLSIRGDKEECDSLVAVASCLLFSQCIVFSK